MALFFCKGPEVIVLTAVGATDPGEGPEKAFEALSREWRRDTLGISVSVEKFSHPAFREIIAMGPEVIPLMLKDMQKHHTHWFYALHVLTGADPVKPQDRGRIRNMACAWLEWGKDHGYI